MINPGKILMCAAAFALTLLTAGCIESEPTIIMKKDGSGTFDLEYSINEQSVTRFNAMIKLREEIAAASGKTAEPYDPLTVLFFNPSEEGWKRHLEKYRKNKITAEKLSVSSRAPARQVHIRVNFEDIMELAATDVFQKYRISVTQNDNGDYTIRRKAGINSDEGYKLSGDSDKNLNTMLQNLRVTVRVNTPGDIIRSNAARLSRYMAEWDFNYSKDPLALSKLQNQLMEVSFSGKVNP